MIHHLVHCISQNHKTETLLIQPTHQELYPDQTSIILLPINLNPNQALTRLKLSHHTYLLDFQTQVKCVKLVYGTKVMHDHSNQMIRNQASIHQVKTPHHVS